MVEHADVEGSGSVAEARRPEPRGMTPSDIGVIVAGVALVLAIPSRTAGWPPFLAPPPLPYLLVLGGLRLAASAGLVLALVVLARRGRYGGPVRPAEWLALGLASCALLDVVPNLDDAVNAYYSAVGSASLDFGVARLLLSAPAAAGLILIVAGSVLLRRRVRGGSRVASTLTALGIVVGWSLWSWGPCEVARLELPYLLVPGPSGDPSSWGWRAPVVFALRDVVANGPIALTWGLPAAAMVRTWRADRRRMPARRRAWTEPAALAVALMAALLLSVLAFTAVGPQASFEVLRRLTFVGLVGLVSWWASGRLGVGCSPNAREAGPQFQPGSSASE
jgi:hypothetical protein